MNISRLLRAEIDAGSFPGVAWGVSEGGGPLQQGALGHRIVTGPRLPVRAGTLFDLASLTKPLATALICLRLADRGELDLEAPLGEAMPRLAGRKLGRLTAIDLLTHRSGLPAWRPFYLSCRSLDQVVDAIARGRGRHPPRTRVLYSDLNYLLLGALLRDVTGWPLDGLFRREVVRPLGLKGIGFNPTPRLRRSCAATERGNRYERAMVGSRGRGYRGFRRKLIWGEVHDHNAWNLGGVAGHAGLFGTVDAVHRIARAMLGDPPQFLSAHWRRRLFTHATPGMDGARAVGLQLASDPGSSAGPALPARAAGHTGFTGTSLWIEPRSAAIYVLLTNRMHPVRGAADMNDIRRRFHQAVASLPPSGH